MFADKIVRNTAPLLRRFGTSAVRRHDHDTTGIPGSNLPFSIKNRFMLVVGFTVFMGTGLGLPFLMVRHQLLKHN